MRDVVTIFELVECPECGAVNRGGVEIDLDTDIALFDCPSCERIVEPVSAA